MLVRPMTIDDCDSILQLDLNIFPDACPWDKSFFDCYFSPGLCFVSCDEETNEINGYIFSNYLEEDKLLISNFAVRPEYRKQGIGSQLMDKVISTEQARWNMDAAFITISLNVRKNNEIAIKFYEKYGFQISDVLSAQEGYQDMQRSLSLPLFADVRQNTDSSHIALSMFSGSIPVSSLVHDQNTPSLG